MSITESLELQNHPADDIEPPASANGEANADSSSSMARHGRAKPWHRSRTRSILVVLWTIFTICLGIMIMVIFVQPQWLGGATNQSGAIVNFGLYRSCTESWRMCSAKLSDFGNISTAWQVSTILVIFSILSTFISIIIMAVYWLRCRETAGFGFRYATGLQVFTGFCLLLTCFIYPGGWGASEVKSICGPSAGSYKKGNCEVKWAYGIAIISMFDAFILALLSFFFIEQKVVSKPLEPTRRPSKQSNGSARHPDIGGEEDNTSL